MTLLHELPADHPLRNTPLGELRADYRNLLTKEWRPISTWKIKANTYNQLGDVWTKLGEFRIP